MISLIIFQLIINKIIEFRDARDWKQFHNPKDVAISLSLEAGEVLEHFQWKNKEEVATYVITHKNEIGEELADVLFVVLCLANQTGINLQESFENKLDIKTKRDHDRHQNNKKLQ